MVDIVVTEELVKNYGDTQALCGLNLRVKKGIFGFIGPNGAGKTTTIKILVGALRPDRGRAYVLGYDSISESLQIRRKIGVLHEKTVYPREMTGYEFLTFVGELYGLSKNEAKAKAKELLDSLDLKNAANKLISRYSAGMKQRLGLAQSLMGNPELVILDEPTANLDPLGRNDLLKRIKRLHQEQHVNFLISSHVLPELQKVCDQIGLINNGLILEQGNIEEIAKKYSEKSFKVIVSDPSVFIKELKKLDFVEKVTTDGNIILVKVFSHEDLYNAVARIVTEKKLQLQLFQQAQADLENLFKTILGG
jgi:ABC-2 type transport system ATP-binding protein